MPPTDIEPGFIFEGGKLEPALHPETPDWELDDWDELAERAAKSIRAIDPLRTIIVEPAQGYSPDGLRYFRPLDVANAVYSVHMYLPGPFTHQGIGENVKAYNYPGVIEGKMWDKAQIEAAFRPAIAFQEKYGVQLYIGEFSAIRWAPDNSAYRYLKDLIEIMEARGWDWTYHSFREWNGWSVEHGEDKQDGSRASQPTDREKLMREWFGRNQKPVW